VKLYKSVRRNKNNYKTILKKPMKQLINKRIKKTISKKYWGLNFKNTKKKWITGKLSKKYVPLIDK
jgi:hypothetical protein